MSKQALNYLLGELERLGYIERLPDPDDLRSRRISVTKRGDAVAAVIREAVAEVEAEWTETARRRSGSRSSGRFSSSSTASNSRPGCGEFSSQGCPARASRPHLPSSRRRGFRVVDTDDPPWSEWSEADGGYVWREDLMTDLLAGDDGPTLYVSGTVSNQGRFYPRFDAVVLLSAPAEVLLQRIATRTTNDYGKSAEERALILEHIAEVEPLLRAGVHARDRRAQPLGDVVDAAGRDRLGLGGRRSRCSARPSGTGRRSDGAGASTPRSPPTSGTPRCDPRASPTRRAGDSGSGSRCSAAAAAKRTRGSTR